MPHPLVYLLACNFKNRLRLRLYRLLHLKYLVSLLAGLIYLAVLFMGPLKDSLKIGELSSLDARSLEAFESLLALWIFGVIGLRWLFAGRPNGLFSHVEMQRLFSAPVSRRALLHYHMARSQVGILFASFLSALIFGQILSMANTGFLLASTWVLYSFLYFSRVGIILLQKALIERGLRRRTLRGGMLVFLALMGLSAAVWARWFVPACYGGERLSAAAPLVWILNITGSGPAYFLLLPFRVMVRPILAGNVVEFWLCLGPALLVVVLLYACIQISKVPLGETSASGIEKARGRSEKTGSFPAWRLILSWALNGPPWAALYWKNLALASGPELRRSLPMLAVILSLVILLASHDVQDALMMIGSVAAWLAAFLAFFGSLLFREDLRTDLKYIDLLKSYPIPGWGVVLGEALGPTTIISFLGWMLLFIAVAALPAAGGVPWGLYDRILLGIAVAIILPFISFLGVLVQNAMVLLLPGWMQLGREHRQGIEAMGQRLITSIATAFFLAVATFPIFVLFSAVFPAVYSLLGTTVFPLASVLAAMALLVEEAAAVCWLGRIYDRFDASLE